MDRTGTSDRAAARMDDADFQDPFHDPVLLGIGIACVLITVVILAMTGLVHWGALYQSPSWSAHSFPPPIAH